MKWIVLLITILLLSVTVAHADEVIVIEAKQETTEPGATTSTQTKKYHYFARDLNNNIFIIPSSSATYPTELPADTQKKYAEQITSKKYTKKLKPPASINDPPILTQAQYDYVKKYPERFTGFVRLNAETPRVLTYQKGPKNAQVYEIVYSDNTKALRFGTAPDAPILPIDPSKVTVQLKGNERTIVMRVDGKELKGDYYPESDSLC